MKSNATLLLKWGTIKGWSGMNEQQVGILQRWSDLGTTLSAMAQKNTAEQKSIICELIDTMEDGSIFNDWDGKHYTRQQAKEYIMGYGV